MIRRWIGIAILAAAWLPGLAWYHRLDWGVWLRELLTRPFTPDEAYLIQADWLLWGVMVAAGTALLVGFQPRLPGRGAVGLAAVLLVPALAVWDWPYRIIPLMGVAGLLLAALPSPSSWWRRVGGGLVLAAVVLAVQVILLLVYEAGSARSHELPRPLATVLAAVASLLGQDSGLSGSSLGLQSMRELSRLGATWELLADPVSLCFLAGGAAFLLMRPAADPAAPACFCRRLGSVLGLTVIVLAWLPLRAGLLIGLYMERVLISDQESEHLMIMNLFWSTPLLLVLLAGPVLMAWRFLKSPPPAGPVPAEGPTSAPSPSPPAPWWRSVATAVLAVLAVAALTAAATWEPVGVRKAGRVIIDEHHSRWEPTDRPMDTEWYGHLSGYNYACAYDYLSRFYEMSRLTQPILDDTLSACDVLVIKCPTEPFTDDELGRLQTYVRGGGSLILIGEHTNVFGTGEYLNDIGRSFGIEFRYDCLFGLDSVFDDRYCPPLIPHPIVQALPPFDFETSCSLAVGNSRGKAVMRATGLKNLPADFHVSNYYPRAFDRADMRYGAWIQLWAARHGRGRVVAFTDSTQWSNFSAFEPGKPELLLGMVEWANHGGGPGNPSVLLALAGLALAAGSLVLARRRAGLWVVLLAAVAAGHAASAIAIAAHQQSAMPLPQPVRPYTLVHMDQTVSDVRLPRSGFIGGKEDGFGIFERWILRLGYFTERLPAGEPPRGNLLVVINPSKDVSTAYRDAVASYVEQGGRLLVLDSPRNYRSTADSLLWPYDLQVAHSYALSGPLTVSPGLPVIPVDMACEIKGGVPISKMQGRPVAACTAYGKGTVTVVGFSSRFCDVGMGVTDIALPDAAMRTIYEYEYGLLRAIINDGLPVDPAAPPTGAGAPSPSK
jgi:hypothetical protein